MKNPVMRTRLNVHKFCLNRSLLGEANIAGVWDKELGGVRLDAQIAEKGISSTHVTGYVSPKLKVLICRFGQIVPIWDSYNLL